MYTHEYIEKNDNGGFEHAEYTSAFEIAFTVCRCYGGEPQEVLDILKNAKSPVRFGGDDDNIWVRELPEVLYSNQYGELKTAIEMEEDEIAWRDYANTLDKINSDWWASIDKASRNGVEL